MASAILSPYQGIDFTSLCLPIEHRKHCLNTFMVTTLFLAIVGTAFGEVVYYYPDPVPVIISGSYGLAFLFVFGWIFYKQITAVQSPHVQEAVEV